MDEILFKVEEKHRGKWQPLKMDNGEEKTVKITEDQASVLNLQSQYHHIRYVKVEVKPKAKVNTLKK